MRKLYAILAACLFFWSVQAWATPPAPVYEVHPEDYYSGGTWDDAFRSAMAACNDPANSKSGCRIVLACSAAYEFADTLDVARSHIIQGCGPMSTRLSWPRGITMVHFHLTGVTCSSDPDAGGAGWAAIRDVTLAAKGAASADRAPGVLVEAPRVTLADVHVIGAQGDGVHVSADVYRSPSSNANLTRLERLRVGGSWGAGLRYDGGDSNAGYSIGLDLANNCIAPEAGVPCAGLIESSFLGNTHLAPHTASNGSGYIIQGNSQRVLLLNPYAEKNQTPGTLSNWSQAIGGIGLWEPTAGLVARGSQLNGLTLVNDKDPANIVTTTLGYAAGPGTFIGMSKAGFYPLRIKADAAKQAFRFDIANLSAAYFLGISATNTGPYVLGTVQLPKFPVIAAGISIPAPQPPAP